jgi:NitT/TauT family transport system ATP-binding protein
MQELLTRVWESHRLTVLFVTHDVDEAVYISDRVLVMSNRPGRLKTEVVIDLPRPRTIEVQETPEFLVLRRRILASIREESLRADQTFATAGDGTDSSGPGHGHEHRAHEPRGLMPPTGHAP